MCQTNQPRENTPWLFRYPSYFCRGERVLDLGCGTGSDAIDIVAYGCRVVALDVDIRRVSLVSSSISADRVVGDVTSGLPFTDSSFSGVVASLSLHYFTSQDTIQVVREIARILTSGGWLTCRVNAVGDVNFGYGVGEEVEPSLFRQPEGHLKRFFNDDVLRRFLDPCFRLERITPRTILQRGVEKQTLECVAQKRG